MINQLIRMAQSHGRLVRGRLAYGNRKVKRESGSSLPFNSRMGLRPRGSRGAVARLPTATAARDRGHSTADPTVRLVYGGKSAGRIHT